MMTGSMILGVLLALSAEGGSAAEVVAVEALDDPGKAAVVVEVREAGGGKALPVRVVVTARDGSHPDGSGYGTYSDGRFFADGSFTVAVPPGRTRVQMSSGPNYVPLDYEVKAEAGKRVRVKAGLRGWFRPEARGWYAGDNHVHAQHDARAVVKTSLAYTALQARANGLSYVSEAGSAIDYSDLKKLDREDFLFRYAPELRPGPFVGHRNTPGIARPLAEERYQRIVRAPLLMPGLAEAVHEQGGAVIYTHPLTPTHQAHWMGSPQALCDGVRGECGDAFDVDSSATEQMWFTLLNLGNRLAVSSYTDAALGRRSTRSPGDRRVYCRAREFSYEAIVGALRKGETFATNGGPVFPFFTVEGKGPGGTLTLAEAGEVEVRAEIHALYPLKQVRLYGRGRVVKEFEAAGKTGEVVLTAKVKEEGKKGWYVLRAEDAQGNWAITSPVYVEPRRPGPRPFAAAVVLEVSNHTRFIQLRKDFFAHLMVTVPPGESLAGVDLLRDGEVVRAFVPKEGNRVAGGKVPVTGIDGDYGPGWVWHIQEGKRAHFQADWPVKEGGWYALRWRTEAWRKGESDAVRFDPDNLNSHALSVVQVVGDGPRFTLWGYGEEMALAEVREPFVGDHWWYPEKTFWRLTTAFDGEEEVLKGGSNRGAAGKFRAADGGGGG